MNIKDKVQNFNNNFKANVKNYIKYYFRKNKIVNKELKNDDVVLEVQHLFKKYHPNSNWVLNDLNFKVYKAQFHAFIGGNGAGKTTTIKSLVGAYKKFEGEIFLNSVNNKLKKSKQYIGYIPEIARFPAGMSTLSYLISMSQISGLNYKSAKARCKELLKQLNIEHLANRSPNSFSSGQKKKILLAQALIHDPKLLIMDEPAANLDPISRLEFFKILKEIQKKDKAIFISSHILSELDKYADSCTVLDGGKIVFSGTKELESENSYLLSVNKEAEFEETLTKNNLHFFKINFLNNYIVKLDNSNQITFLEDLLNNKIISSFKKHDMTLEDIYSKYVLKDFYNNKNNN